MKMKFKKEVKHSVVYETDDPKAAVRSVYVMKDWLATACCDGRDLWPSEIELEIQVRA